MSTNAKPNPQPRDDLASKLKRTELQHAASSIPGREIVQALTEIPAVVEWGWHQHPGEEVGYIVVGTVRMEIEGHPTSPCTLATRSSRRRARPTTRSTSDPRRAGCSRPTSSRWVSRSRRFTGA